MEIHIIRKGHPLWEEMIGYAENCTWKAGPVLAKKMRENDFRDWERVIAAAGDQGIAGFCTITGTDELPEEYGYTPFAGFVFVDERHRGQRISERMIDRACLYAKELGHPAVYLMSGEKGLYEKYGFQKIGDFRTVYGTTDQLFRRDLR